MLDANQRRLTTHQKAVLIQVLRTFPDERVGICYSASASDAHAYAHDFLSVFRAIGWDVDGPEAADAPVEEFCGLALIGNEAGLPPCAEALRDALRIYGIEVKTQCPGTRNVAAGRFVLRVGRAC
jgi:hypothetical protein